VSDLKKGWRQRLYLNIPLVHGGKQAWAGTEPENSVMSQRWVGLIVQGEYPGKQVSVAQLALLDVLGFLICGFKQARIENILKTIWLYTEHRHFFCSFPKQYNITIIHIDLHYIKYCM
jgi:hypothetical protein